LLFFILMMPSPWGNSSFTSQNSIPSIR
jgi:hypothetical protein